MSEPLDQTYKFARGATMFHQGYRADFCYLLLSGRVEAFRMDGDKKVLLGEVGEGGVVGEMALIDPAPRSATVVAVEATVGRRITAATLERALDSSPPLARYLLRTLIRNIRFISGMKMPDAPAEFMTGEMMAATVQSEQTTLRVLDRKVYQAKEAIFRAGQPGYNLFLVQSGRVDLVREAAEGNPEIRLRGLGPGEVFGELALLTGSTRRASAIAGSEGAVCETITADHFKAIVNACPPVVKALMRIYADIMEKNALQPPQPGKPVLGQ